MYEAPFVRSQKMIHYRDFRSSQIAGSENRRKSRAQGEQRGPNLLILSAEACVTTILLRSGTGKLVALSVRVVLIIGTLV